MRYAVISDIHGNINAFRAVLEDAKSRCIDSYIFLGDYITSLSYPDEVVSAIRKIQHKHVVRGNSEEYVSNLEKNPQSTWNDIQFYSLYWSYRALTKDNRDYVKRLPAHKKITDEYVDIFAFHKCGHYFGNTILDMIDSRYFKENIGHYTPSKYIEIIKQELRDDKKLKDRLAQLPDGVYAYGHNHIQMHIEIDNKLILNPGSCGVPLDYPNGAAYSILEITDNGWHVEELRIPYDLEETIKQFRQSDLYSFARVWCEILIKHLETGRPHGGYFLNFIRGYADKPYSLETWERAYELWCKETEQGEI